MRAHFCLVRGVRSVAVFVLVLAVLTPAVGAADGPETSAVFALSDFEPVRRASALLVRAAEAVWYQVETAELPRGETATVWFCGWNDPSVCVNGPGTCGSDPADLEPDVPGSFCIWGGGGIVDRKGRLEVNGMALARRNQRVDVLFGAFTNAAGAEINLVVKTHGAQLPDALFEQLTTFDGGCEANECAEVQLAIFPAP